MNTVDRLVLPRNLVQSAEPEEQAWLADVLPVVVARRREGYRALTITRPAVSRGRVPRASDRDHRDPAAKTSAAQIAAPRSCGGLPGQIQGVVQPASSAYSATTV
jgi:hypothetical protein